jgi:threonine dehydrogenase-like Zn-dependent dehydrogenase
VKAVCWRGTQDIRVETVPDPHILNTRDIIVRITLTAICGSDLHLYNGYIPGMRSGDILGHEFMGEVVECGRQNGLHTGDRVVVPFAIACGHCFFCRSNLFSLCDNSNPNAELVEKLYGHSGAGLFGYSHLFGGFAGGQAQYVRVPYGDVGPIKVPPHLSDEQVLFLSDIFPTGYMAAENCQIQPGDSVAVWGCGPVGQFAIKSAFLLGAERVFAIDHVPSRLRMAQEQSGAIPMDYNLVNVVDALRDQTGGMGPDACIDAVGLEAHGSSIDAIYDRVKQAARLATDRAHALRQAIQACRKGGVVSIPGVYGGVIDKFNFGAAFGKGLTLKMGQTHVQKYMPRLLQLIEEQKIDPSFIITHRMSLDDAPEAYHVFQENRDLCLKVVLRPGEAGNGQATERMP